MSVGDITKIPTAGIQFDFEVTAVGGNTTTMYIGSSKGRIRSLTSAGVLADLTTKIQVNEKIVAVAYVSSSLVFVTDKGKIYTVGTNGSSLTKIADLQTDVLRAYYYNTYVYCLLANVYQGKSSAVKVQIA